jgi:diadenosine tetraphosphatase ApaH/serine/threonine PP2A family protein phosphatase
MQECHIAILVTLYEPRRYKTTGISLALGWADRSGWSRFWRELPETEREDDGRGTAHLPGCWVILGQIDVSAEVMRWVGEGDFDTTW